MPAILFAEELIAAYPKAKVILTHRNFDTWYKYAVQSFCLHLHIGEDVQQDHS
jgi:hypothetical protein